MMEYSNTWGTLQCFQGTDDNEIYPEDMERLFSINPNGKVFNCIDKQGDYLILQYGEEVFKVKNKLYKVVDEPIYKIGNEIKVIDSNLKGIIVDISWHYNKHAPMYFIEVNGKRKSRRYSEMDFRLI